MSANVFISYNHNDTDLANRVREDLENAGFQVIIDSDNPIGFEIPRFINESIAKADFVLQLISEHFLTSAWVAQESIKAFTVAELIGKVVLPCEIDNSLSDFSFRTNAMKRFDTKIAEIKAEIGYRLETGASIQDLQSQYQRLLGLKNGYDTIMAEFINKNRGDLRPANYERGMKQVITSLNKYLSMKK